MASASLIVRIAADMNDFSRQLSAMTRDVDRAAKKVSDIGQKMSLGITLPVGLATLALGKMATENQSVANKMSRDFGPATARVNDELERLMKLVPETGTDMQKMAIQTKEFASDLGMAAPKAVLMTEGMMQMSAQLSAGKMISMGEAVDAVTKAMQGQTKGLKALQITIDPAQVKQEAFRLGLARVGQELSPLGTALATYSVLAKRSGEFAGEAGARHQDVGRKLQFVKRDLMEFADSTSNLLLPALGAFAALAKTVVGWLNLMPDGLKQGSMWFLALAAAIGPVLILVSKLTQAVTTLRAAMELMADGSALKKFLGLLTSPKILLAVAAIAVAIGGAMALWSKFHKDAEEKTADLPKLPDVKDLLGGATTLPKDPFTDLREGIDEVTKAFELAMRAGLDLTGVVKQLGDKKHAARQLAMTSSDPKVQLGAAEQYNQLQDLLATANVAATIGRDAANQGAVSKSVGVAAGQQSSPELRRFQLAQQLVGDELNTFGRELAVTVNAFDATRMAMLEFKERAKQAGNDFAKSVASFKYQWQNAGASAKAGMFETVGRILENFTPMGLAIKAIGAVLQGLQPFIDALFVPLTEFGRILGLIIEPVLRPLFQALKVFAIVTALAGEVVYTVFSGIARFVGNILKAIGGAIAKIPFLGGVGKEIKNGGQAMIDLADSFGKTAKDLDKARIELQNMSFDDARDGVQNLGDAARNTAEALYQVPQAWKIALERFRAIAPQNGDGSAPSSGGSSSGGSSGGGTGGGGGGGSDGADGRALAMDDRTPVANLVVDGKVLAQVTWGHIRAAASRKLGTPMRVAELASVI